MAEAMLLIIWVGTSLFFIIREIRDKDARESRERWITDVRDLLYSIENEFRCRCQEIIDDAISQHKYNTYVPQLQINNLRLEYIDSFCEKVDERKGKYFALNIPRYIEREYERNISDIADIYRNLCNTLQEKLQ